MKFTYTIIVLLLILTACMTSHATIIPGRIVVKFKAHSSLVVDWNQRNRSGAFAQFTSLIGTHTSRGYISDATLQAVTKRERELRPSFRRSITESIADNLSRICVLECAETIDCQLLARKISSNPEVEYAEVMHRQTIISDPNDTELGRQYNIRKVQAIAAWDELPSGIDPILMAIVDTGVDYDHEDLAANIYTHPGESGNDTQGRDKRSNGVDDDGNGFVDDWRGWDFVGNTGSAQDNDPRPGNVHGTHVAGIAAAVVNNALGIAGIARNVRILPVKVSSDNVSNITVDNGYEAILYAATMGAKVINCSWGVDSPGNSEAETIASVFALGSLVVAGAGNDGNNRPFYPGAYTGVVSVGATIGDDQKAGYSNFHQSVDVCAPGSSVYSTLPGNRYGNESGTSMSSPCAAGVAALICQKFPLFTPLQVAEQLKATCDNIDSINPEYLGFIGHGRVNAYRAVTDNNARALQLSNYEIIDENGDGIYEIGEKMEVKLTVKNILSPVHNITIKPQSPPEIILQFTDSTISAGSFNTLEEKALPTSLQFTIPSNTPDNYVMTITLKFIDSTGVITDDYFTVTVNPTYRTMSANNISVTFNSVGNIGYNDFPSNSQGDGFLYKGKGSLLFEGALMVGTSAVRLSNSARSAFSGNQQDKSFERVLPFNIKMPGIVALQDGATEFTDRDQSADAGVLVKQKAYQFKGDSTDDVVFLTYDITNISQEDFTTLHAGLYFDWDIGPSGQNNVARLDEELGFGYAYCIKPDTLPVVAAMLLSPHKLNFFAIDNDGSGGTNPGIYNGFTRNVKWQTLSNGIGRRASNVTDVSMVISAGPISLPINQTVRVGFAIGAADRKEMLPNIMKKAQEKAADHNISKGFTFAPPSDSVLATVYPNVLSNGICTVDYSLPDQAHTKIDVVNILGMIVRDVHNSIDIAGQFKRQFVVDDLVQGMYFVRFQSFGRSIHLPLFVVR
ncbi:MAG: S8 family serine peptidase [Ignavibacteria bacterium]|nr:S8 family serine peptidase [Ignavibacteria bacterium]